MGRMVRLWTLRNGYRGVSFHSFNRLYRLHLHPQDSPFVKRLQRIVRSMDHRALTSRPLTQVFSWMYEDLTLIGMARKAMDWVAQRQEVLSENIANADTPHYLPSDLKELNFDSVLKKVGQPTITPVTTDPHHIVPKLVDPNVVVVERKAYESSPDGNAVVLEEQMSKIGDSKGMYDQVTALFQKNVSLLRTAITGR